MYNPNHIEQEILEFWKKNDIFQKLRSKNHGKKPWSFIDGPITANNPMGVHHAWGRTYKDIYQRFKAMQGFDQRFQNGFDCQGLWLEVETEKELGFNSKKDIEGYGLANFSRACRARVERFSKIQTEQSIKLGQWMAWNNSYYTMSDENIEAIWYFLKKCHEKGWLYKGTKVLPWCNRCGTSSSKHEMSDEGYSEMTHLSIYIKAKIKNKSNEYLLLWTTTEWTLSSNIAAAVNPGVDYIKAQQDGNIYYLAKSLESKLGSNYKILKTIKGKDLLGLEYESFYPDFEIQKRVVHKVVLWDEVTEEEGTGIVHIAPTCGEEDYILAKKENLQILSPALDEFGNYNAGFGWLTGKNVAKVKDLIIKDLEDRNILFKTEPYTHRYPVCWRCKTELVFRLDSEWFISCKKIRLLMKKEARNVIWYPKHIGKLMQDWLNNMDDWNISRKRYWGLPLMFYECCGKVTVIGSKKELKDMAVNSGLVNKLPELHRPWIDEVKIKCPSCGKAVTRIKEVGDCWLDAGIVPFSTLHYFDDKKYWRKWFPADLVIEARAQVRLWFYSLLFMSVTLEEKAPYKRVFAYEEVRNERGETMHKSKGNTIWFDEAVEKMGADVMRWMYAIQNPSLPINFGYTYANEVKRNLTVIWNLSKYVDISCKNIAKEINLDPLSSWMVSKRESLKLSITSNLENMQPNIAMRELKEYFLDTLSRGYAQYVRENLDDPKIQAVLYNSFIDGIILMAPFLPFISEKVYSLNSAKKESIFLESWPKPDHKKINKKLETEFELIQDILKELFASREKVNINVRWPLKEAIIHINKPSSVKKFLPFLKQKANIKQISIKKSNILKVQLNTVLTPELELEGYVRELTRRIQQWRKQNNLEKTDKIELAVVSPLNLSRWQKELQQKVGAIKLTFEPKIKYKFMKNEKIRDKEFKLLFNII